MNPTTIQYFASKNIDVSFDTLARTPELIQAYINETQDIVKLEPKQMSENVKHACYNLFYPLHVRPRLTGFEGFKKIDSEYRIANSGLVTVPQVRPAQIFDKQPTASTFKQTLKNSFADFTKPIYLYLSGGLDSTLVAAALMDANKSFTPVIFNWTQTVEVTNPDGSITTSEVTQNLAETQNAIDFCNTFSLTPHIETVNIPALWATPVFKQLSIDAGIVSPQLTTHAWMVEHIATQFPNVQHVFGGEVRYRTNYIKTDDITPANIVLLGKVTPGYVAGSPYTVSAVARFFATATATITFNADGTWAFTPTWNGSSPWPAGNSGPTSGTWAVAPFAAGGYRIRVSAVSDLSAAPGPNGTTPTVTSFQAPPFSTVASAYFGPAGGSNDDRRYIIYFEVTPTNYPLQINHSAIDVSVSAGWNGQ